MRVLQVVKDGVIDTGVRAFIQVAVEMPQTNQGCSKYSTPGTKGYIHSIFYVIRNKPALHSPHCAVLTTNIVTTAKLLITSFPFLLLSTTLFLF